MEGATSILPYCVPERCRVENDREGKSVKELARGMHQNGKGACVSLIWPEWLGPPDAPPHQKYHRGAVRTSLPLSFPLFCPSAPLVGYGSSSPWDRA